MRALTVTLRKKVTVIAIFYEKLSHVFLKKRDECFEFSFHRLSTKIISIIVFPVSWHYRFIRAQKQSKKTQIFFESLSENMNFKLSIETTTLEIQPVALEKIEFDPRVSANCGLSRY